MNDAGQTVREIRGVTANYRATKKGDIVTVKIGLVLSPTIGDRLPALMHQIDAVQRRLINAAAHEFLP